MVKPREDCPNIDVNADDCACNNNDCDRYAFCCACIEYHRSQGGTPACV